MHQFFPVATPPVSNPQEWKATNHWPRPSIQKNATQSSQHNTKSKVKQASLIRINLSQPQSLPHHCYRNRKNWQEPDTKAMPMNNLNQREEQHNRGQSKQILLPKAPSISRSDQERRKDSANWNFCSVQQHKSIRKPKTFGVIPSMKKKVG